MNPVNTTTEVGSKLPELYLSGTWCDWELRVGLGFGIFKAPTGFLVISRKYGAHLAVSHKPHEGCCNERKGEGVIYTLGRIN